MWIVSQSGNGIYNTDTMSGIETSNKAIEICHSGARKVLGVYSSNKKVDAVKSTLIYKNANRENQFQMPKDEEVVV